MSHQAALELKKLGPAAEKAVPVLIEVINNPKEGSSNKYVAAEALEAIGTEEAMDVFNVSETWTL